MNKAQLHISWPYVMGISTSDEWIPLTSVTNNAESVSMSWRHKEFDKMSAENVYRK